MSNSDASFTLPQPPDLQPPSTSRLSDAARQELRMKETLGLFNNDRPIPLGYTIGDVLQLFYALPKDLQEAYKLEAQIIVKGKAHFIEHVFQEKEMEGMSDAEIVRYAESEWRKKDKSFQQLCIKLGHA